MDPVTAVGLVSNVTQLVELSWKIVSKGREIHEHGALPEHRDAETVTADLRAVNDQLLSCLLHPSRGNELNPDDEALRRLCESSNAIAGKLVGRLQKLQANKPGTWKSIRHALKSVWVKSELDETAARLQGYRAQLNTRLIVAVREKIDALHQNTNSLATNLSGYPALLAASQDTQTNYLTRLISSEHDKTREILSQRTVKNGQTQLFTSGSSKPPDWTSADVEPRMAIFEAVHAQSIASVRSVLRQDPSSILALNDFGQTPLHIAASTGNLDLVTYLIRNGASISPGDDHGKLPLHYAVMSGSTAVVRAMLAKGADTQAQDDEGRFPRDFSDPISLMHWILRHGANLEAQDDFGNTALHHFAKEGDFSAVTALLDQRADIEAIEEKGFTPLLRAAGAGQADVVALLIERGANVNYNNGAGATPLSYAVYRGHVAVSEQLLDAGANINELDEDTPSPLTMACQSKLSDAAIMLLRRGAEPNIRASHDHIPLHVAARYNLISLVQAILERGGDVNNRATDTDSTALAEACRHGHIEAARLLLEHGADTELCDEKRCTPLWEAVHHGHSDTVELLVGAGANVDAAGEHAQTPLHEASHRNDVRSVKLLLAAGADPNCRSSRDTRCASPLSLAAEEGHLAVLRALLQCERTSVDLRDLHGWTALARAARHGHTEIIEVLLAHGANVNSQDSRQFSPLHRAAQQPSSAPLTILLDTGEADVDLENCYGRTALAEASYSGNVDVVRSLLKYGANAGLLDNNGWSSLDIAKRKDHAHIVSLLDQGFQEIDGIASRARPFMVNQGI